MTSHAQPWKYLNRQQKDSVIYNHFNQGNWNIGLGLGASGLAGGWHGFSYKLEPTLGFFIFKRQLISLSLIYEQAKTSYEDDFKKSHQILCGAYYRYYLPERKMLHLFFGEVGILGGKFYGSRNISNVEETKVINQLKLSITGGISFSVNKFNLEIGFTQEYELINQQEIDYFFAGKTMGLIKVSYCF